VGSYSPAGRRSKEEQVGRGTVNLSDAQCGARRERRSFHCPDLQTHSKASAQKPLYYFTCSCLTALGMGLVGVIHSFCKHDLVV